MNRYALILVFLLAACGSHESPVQQSQPAAPAADAGNATRGAELAAQYGCNVCHIIPGVTGPRGSLGPSLAKVAAQPTLAYGTVPNTPDNLRKYIQSPPTVYPQTTMPVLGVTDQDARDITAHLLTLK